MKFILTLLTVFVSATALAQRFKTIELKPIIKSNGTYFYDLKRVHGGAYALQIPLQSLNDEQVNQYYKRFRSWRVAETTVAFVPIVYLLSLPQHQYVNRNEFWTVYGSSIVAIIGAEIIAKHHLRKGIDRYNTLVIGTSANAAGLSIQYLF